MTEKRVTQLTKEHEHIVPLLKKEKRKEKLPFQFQMKHRSEQRVCVESEICETHLETQRFGWVEAS